MVYSMYDLKKLLLLLTLSIIWIFLKLKSMPPWKYNNMFNLTWSTFPKVWFFFQPKHGATLLLNFLWPAHYITFITTKDNNLNVFCMCKNEQQQNMF